METLPVIIIGAGLAGLGAAYTLVRAGVETLVLERGDYPGAKNTTGGRLYVEPIRSLFPDLWQNDPPWERKITREGVTLMGKEGSVAIDIAVPVRGESFSVLRARFDRWLAQQVEAQGAMIMTKTLVTGIVEDRDRIVGVRVGDEIISADWIIAADGTLSLIAEQAGLHRPLPSHHMAVGVKEVITLPAERIEERLRLRAREGAAWLYLGEVTARRFGGGFVYTNGDSISVGLVVALAGRDRAPTDISLPQLLENFTSRPEIAALIGGGERGEYAAHLLPEGGKGGLLPCYRPGLLVAGDAAGLALNFGYTVRGMDYALASGYYAAQSIIDGTPHRYPGTIAASFIGHDFDHYAAMPQFLSRHRLYDRYPEQVVNFLSDLYSIPPDGKERVATILKKHFNWRDIGGILSDFRWLLKT